MMVEVDPALRTLGEILKGESITDAPVVTKNVLLGSARQHNKCIDVLRQGCDILGSNFKVIVHQQETLLATLGALEGQVGVQETKLEELDQRVKKSDLQVAQLWTRMNKIAALEAQQQQQVLETRAIQSWCEQLSEAREQEALAFRQQFDVLEGGLSEQDQSILTIQGKLSRLSQELYISSDQVNVRQLESTNSPRLDSGLTSLTSELERMASMSQEMTRSLELQRRMTSTHTKELEMKASKETEKLAKDNETRLQQIKKFLDANMDVDLMDVRRNQDLILSQLEDYQRELDERTTEDQVDTRIQHRYDELVTHLQIALRSVQDDEANFKACVRRIEETNSELKSTKAERSELKELRAQLGVQLTEVTKAAHELSPEARALLNSAVRREEMLIMLQDKAENSFVETLSSKTASLIQASDKVQETISDLSGQQTEALSLVAAASERRDGALSSRLDGLEAALVSIRVSGQALQKNQTIKLPAAQTQPPTIQTHITNSTVHEANDLPDAAPLMDQRDQKALDTEHKAMLPSRMQESIPVEDPRELPSPEMSQEQPSKTIAAKPGSMSLVSYLQSSS